ncbi:unnamed protein product [Arabis nemorensis]|uniref:Uncharacterized protein n=1 Tax=Arabis nemorensis TaxID=586526 RepID=A0A565BHA1_9BRAS|nr:unnamed protein product [Arabis nemorensis]
MSSVSTEADDTEIAKLPETETETPPLKKQKTDSQAEGDTEMTNLGDSTELETVPDESKAEAEGYDVDWDNLDFYFETVKLEDVPSDVPSLDVNLKNKELIELLIKTAIDEENDENVTTSSSFNGLIDHLLSNL